MDKCIHESCGREARVWLPTGNNTSEVVPHPWCKHCGVVKNISYDRPKEFGYWMNILSRIKNNYSLKKVQIRLVSKYLESNIYFNDLYGITGSAQSELFIKTVSRICKIPKQYIDSLVY